MINLYPAVPIPFSDKMGEEYNIRGASGVSAFMVVVSVNLSYVGVK
jgi:hypothetical protein